jgi:hypothetical protein
MLAAYWRRNSRQLGPERLGAEPETWFFECSAVGDAGDVPRTETQRFMSLLQRDLVYARARGYV